MILAAWLFIGTVATLVTAGTILVPDDGWAIVLGVAGFVSWAIVAYGAFDVTVVGDSVTYSFAMPIVTLFALIMSIIPGYIALTGPVDLITSWRTTDADEL